MSTHQSGLVNITAQSLFPSIGGSSIPTDGSSGGAEMEMQIASLENESANQAQGTPSVWRSQRLLTGAV